MSIHCIEGPAAIQGVHITLRMRLHCQIIRAGNEYPSAGDVYEVLNEVVVDRGSNPYLTKIECWESHRLITKVHLLLSCKPCFTFKFVPRLRLARLTCGQAIWQSLAEGVPCHCDSFAHIVLLVLHDITAKHSGEPPGLCSAHLVSTLGSKSVRASEVVAAGTSGWRPFGNPHRQHGLLSGSWRLHGPPKRARHPVHACLPALLVLQASTCIPVGQGKACNQHPSSLRPCLLMPLRASQRGRVPCS